MAREHFDTVIVGARCAGAALAALLAKRGLSVAVLEQATFPKPALSTHLKQADALAFLARLGVLERIRATGAPFITHVDWRLGDCRFVAPLPLRPGDVGGGACVRRVTLDAILADAAAEAGAELRMDTKVSGVLWEGGRVAGVRAIRDGVESELLAPLVVGADGRNSTVAKATGARKYNVWPNQRVYYWAYFEGADLSADPTFVLHRWADRFMLAAPSDSGLYMALVSPETGEREAFRTEPETTYMDLVRRFEPVASLLSGARRVSKISGIVRFDGYFREPSGPGWALAGDAGHFKDPAAGRGIGDAFMQVDELAPAIVSGLDGSADGLDRALVRWGRWRDREFADHYWRTADLGRVRPLPLPLPEMLRDLTVTGHTDHFLELVSNRARPSEVFSPSRFLRASARLARRRSTDRRVLAIDFRDLLVDDLRRRWLNRRPAFADAETPTAATSTGRGESAKPTVEALPARSRP